MNLRDIQALRDVVQSRFDQQSAACRKLQTRLGELQAGAPQELMALTGAVSPLEVVLLQRGQRASEAERLRQIETTTDALAEAQDRLRKTVQKLEGLKILEEAEAKTLRAKERRALAYDIKR